MGSKFAGRRMKTRVIEPLHDGNTQVMPSVPPPTTRQLTLLSTDERRRQAEPCEKCGWPAGRVVVVILLLQAIAGEAIIAWLIATHRLSCAVGHVVWVCTIR